MLLLLQNTLQDTSQDKLQDKNPAVRSKNEYYKKNRKTILAKKKRERDAKKVIKKTCGDHGGRCQNNKPCGKKESKSGGYCSLHKSQENISESIPELIQNPHPRISHEELMNNEISIASNT